MNDLILFFKADHNIRKSSDGLFDQARKRSDLNNFSIQLHNLFSVIVPEHLAIAEHITNVYDSMIDDEDKHSICTQRCAEDIKDIYERKIAIDGFIDRYNKALNEYEIAKTRYIKNKGADNEELYHAKAKEYLEILKKSLNELIEQKRKFATFVKGRLSHAFLNYGITLGEYSQKQKELNQKIVNLIKKEVLENPDFLFDK